MKAYFLWNSSNNQAHYILVGVNILLCKVKRISKVKIFYHGFPLKTQFQASQIHSEQRSKKQEYVAMTVFLQGRCDEWDQREICD